MSKLQVLRILSWSLRIGTFVALASLILEFGFPVGSWLEVLHRIDIFVVAVFAADALARLACAPDRRVHARRHWLELLLVALLLVESLSVFAITRGSALARIYIVGAQVYLLARMGLGVLRVNERLTAGSIRPAWFLVGSFLVLILLGAGLLMTPNARAPGAAPWSFVDAVFTSTSAACVTGLGVRNVGSELSRNGQAVLMALMQIGGLGLPTFVMFVAFLQQRSLRMRQSTLMGDLMSARSTGGMGRFLGWALGITFVAETLGGFLLHNACPGKGRWWAAFHSVSAFNNAGFGLASDSFIGYAGSAQVCLTIILLIVLGGLGFPVILELLHYRVWEIPLVRHRRWRPGKRETGPAARLSLHAKIVIVMTLLLITAGAGLFYLAERDGALAGQGVGEQALTSVFQSVTARTAGFNTVDFGKLRLPTLLLVIVLMAVGASPVSTGGGIKTSAVAVLGLTVRGMLRNRDRVEAFGRTVPQATVNASVAVVVLYTLGVLVVTTLLAATQEGMEFMQVLFESVSALSTVGLTTGVTPKTDVWGRLILTAAMLVGRVGPLAIVWSVVSRPSTLRYEYPGESVIVS